MKKKKRKIIGGLENSIKKPVKMSANILSLIWNWINYSEKDYIYKSLLTEKNI